jgi:hypothetical protein
MVEMYEKDIGELGCVVTDCGLDWTVEDRRECVCRLQRI